MGRYNREFIAEAVKLVIEQNYKPAVAARKLGLPDSTYNKWLENAGYKGGQEPLSDDVDRLKLQVRDLQAQVKRLETEKEILKKATAYFANQQS
jgi:transposase